MDAATRKTLREFATGLGGLLKQDFAQRDASIAQLAEQVTALTAEHQALRDRLVEVEATIAAKQELVP